MQEHRTLTEFRIKWVGKRVVFFSGGQCYEGQKHRATVIGVGDDGMQAEKDARRHAKPTGLLFVKRDDWVNDEVFDSNCSVI